MPSKPRKKAIKAVLTFLQIDFPKTHNLEYLLNLLPTSIERADGMDKAFKLTPYATIFRYPGEEEPVGYEEYRRLLQMADQTVVWAKIIIE